MLLASGGRKRAREAKQQPGQTVEDSARHALVRRGACRARIVEDTTEPREIAFVFLEQRPHQVRAAEHTKQSALGVDAKETIEYHIVGSAEANPSENKLSNESPVGKAIIGRKKGETVEVAAPRGTLKFKIMDIQAA